MSKPNEKNIVFLSHSSKDKKQLVPFKKALEEKTSGTIQFYLSSDGQSIPLGHNWVASVEHSLDEAKLAFLLLTANSIDSTWVAFEAGFMHAKKIRVIPVALPGIDLGQVPPPIGLLQGFNMHSHETMNNFFEILNQEFQHQHKPSFTQDDFRKLVGADSELGLGFFGEYSGLVRGISFTGKSGSQSLISDLEAEFSKIKITLTQSKQINLKDRTDERIYSVAVCPGLNVTIDGEQYSVTLHREMFSLLLDLVCSVISKSCPQPYQANINCIKGVSGCGSDIHISARAFGTEFTVQPHGQFTFRQIELNLFEDELRMESQQPFKADDIRAMVTLLFDSGMLEFKQPKQIDPAVAGLANVVMRMRRK